jgi:hypothetical protein
MNIEQIAKIAHELNRQYCITLGDDSQPSWEDAPEWQRNSIISGVKAHILDPLLTPEESHNLWLKQKTDEGWSWGPTKDVEAKTHPCFRPYNELPSDMKVKDYNFKTIVNQLKPFWEQEFDGDGKVGGDPDFEKKLFDDVEFDKVATEIDKKRSLIDISRDLFSSYLSAVDSVLYTIDIADTKKSGIRDLAVRKFMEDNNYLPELQELLK